MRVTGLRAALGLALAAAVLSGAPALALAGGGAEATPAPAAPIKAAPSTKAAAAAKTAQAPLYSAMVKPGDVITKANAYKVKNLVSPGNFVLVKQGMVMDIVPTSTLGWPPPYKAATEKYASQVALGADGSLKNYVAGLPFPLLDANDPQVADKIMWNFSFRPLYTDDMDLREIEVATYSADSHGSPLGFFTVGHFAFYNNIGRIEVKPFPTDPDFKETGIRYRFGMYPFMTPSDLTGYGMVRYRHLSPKIEDNTWIYDPTTRRLRRESAEILSDAIAAVPGFGGGAGGAMGAAVSGGGASPYVNTLDPDSYFGFAAKITDFTYKFLGERVMLACVHAKHSPEQACPYDGGRTVCPENWELRRLYVIEADAKPDSGLSIQRRILYIDSEGWFITASDQYDRKGNLWKTLASFHTYRDRPVPDARIAIYPYKRMFQLALVDEDVTSGTSSVVYMPGPHSQERECWYIDMGLVDKSFFSPSAMANAGH